MNGSNVRDPVVSERDPDGTGTWSVAPTSMESLLRSPRMWLGLAALSLLVLGVFGLYDVHDNQSPVLSEGGLLLNGVVVACAATALALRAVSRHLVAQAVGSLLVLGGIVAAAYPLEYWKNKADVLDRQGSAEGVLALATTGVLLTITVTLLVVVARSQHPGVVPKTIEEIIAEGLRIPSPRPWFVASASVLVLTSVVALSTTQRTLDKFVRVDSHTWLAAVGLGVGLVSLALAVWLGIRWLLVPGALTLAVTGLFAWRLYELQDHRRFGKLPLVPEAEAIVLGVTTLLVVAVTLWVLDRPVRRGSLTVTGQVRSVVPDQ
jgi:hypothetical protein